MRVAHRIRAGLFCCDQLSANLCAGDGRFGVAGERQGKSGCEDKSLVNAFHDVATFKKVAVGDGVTEL